MSFAATVASRNGTQGSNSCRCLKWYCDFGAELVVAAYTNSQFCIGAPDKETSHCKPVVRAIGNLLYVSYDIGIPGYICCIKKRVKGYRRKYKVFHGLFSRYENSS